MRHAPGCPDLSCLPSSWLVSPGAWLGNFGYTPLTVGVTGSQTLTFQAAMPFGISGIKNVTLDVNGMYR